MRFAALAVLYTWMQASDHQVIYETTSPYRVWSVDHGHFFVGTPQWTPAALAAVPPVAQLDLFFQPVGLRRDELAGPFDRLEAVTVEDIAQAVARPPDEWGVRIDERSALCMFLYERRERVLALRTSP
jgi:hypothetical protein